MPKAQHPAAGHRNPLGARCNPVLIWIVPATLFAPYTLAIYLGTLKLTPGKLLTTLLVIPAIVTLLAGVLAHRRRLVTADLLALALAVWLIVAPVSVSGSDVFVAAASQALEFFGSYMIGRAFFFGSEALSTFGKALATVVIVLAAFGLLDTLTHRYVVSETLAAVFFSPGQALDPNYPQLNRSLLSFELLRAASTFDHPILYGMFCATSASVLIYAPPSRVRLIGVMSCALGCVLALSSAPILALGIVGAVAFYDILLGRAAWRWKALLALMAAALGAICAVSNNPITWIIRNLTFDPQTGYFRLLLWDAAFPYIDANLWTGNGFQQTGNAFVDGSLDNVWLGKALAYGLPGVGLLFLLGMTVIVPVRGAARVRARQVDLDRLCTGFSLAIVLFGVIGLTVYYWNGVWLYAALCLGIRASLKEQCWIAASSRTRAAMKRVRRDTHVRDPARPQLAGAGQARSQRAAGAGTIAL